MCEFPGRRWLEWALLLPLAIPGYVLAFVAIGFLDYAGPVAIRAARAVWLIELDAAHSVDRWRHRRAVTRFLSVRVFAGAQRIS